MRVAKPTEKDFQTTNDFLLFMEMLFDTRMFHQFNWKRDFDKNDIEHKILTRCEKELSEEFDCNPEDLDERVVLFEAIKRMYQRCDTHWRRALLSGEILIENVCDQDADYLKLHPFTERVINDNCLGE